VEISRVPDAAIIVACSGGADSVAAAHLAVEAGASVMALVHIDHGLRPDSASEFEVVGAHAADLDVRALTFTVTVDRRGSTEDSARRARWGALRAAAACARASYVATGHTADDQAETVLMRLARGSGITGLRAMRPLEADVWRPLLSWRRDDVRRLCHERGWSYADDPTNVDRRHERNRIRLDVLPALGPRAVPALSRLAALAADDDDLLEALVDDAPIERLSERSVAIPLAWLTAAHPALARRAIRRATRLAGADHAPAADRIDEARQGLPVSLGAGLASRRDGPVLVIGPDPRFVADR